MSVSFFIRCYICQQIRNNNNNENNYKSMLNDTWISIKFNDKSFYAYIHVWITLSFRG